MIDIVILIFARIVENLLSDPDRSNVVVMDMLYRLTPVGGDEVVVNSDYVAYAVLDVDSTSTKIVFNIVGSNIIHSIRVQERPYDCFTTERQVKINE